MKFLEFYHEEDYFEEEEEHLKEPLNLQILYVGGKNSPISAR